MTWAALPWRLTAPFCAPLVAVADADVENPPVFDGRVELPRVPVPEPEGREAVTVAELLTVSVELPSPWSSVVLVEPWSFRSELTPGAVRVKRREVSRTLGEPEYEGTDLRDAHNGASRGRAYRGSAAGRSGR